MTSKVKSKLGRPSFISQGLQLLLATSIGGVHVQIRAVTSTGQEGQSELTWVLLLARNYFGVKFEANAFGNAALKEKQVQRHTRRHTPTRIQKLTNLAYILVYEDKHISC